jgi:hypothetical protein
MIAAQNKSYYETIFEQLLLDDPEIPPFEREYRFHPTRMWRFDFAWPEHMLALEIEGGAYGRPVICHNCGARVMRRLKDGRNIMIREGGRHTSGKGFEKDLEKYGEAAVLGWRVIRINDKMIERKTGEDMVKRAINNG